MASSHSVVALLGGDRIFARPLDTALDVHDVLMQGLPGAALNHLVDRLTVLRERDSLEKAVGMSLRTLQRRKLDSSRPLDREQSNRTWKFAEILAEATGVFGSQEEAEHWLERPATGLDRRRPIDLLETQAGVEMVEDFLGRLKHGVYT
jgi:putative toxin-antitoxin system antitoxin component (TIGR02293 family)